MAQFWKASSVTVNNGDNFVTVNTGDDVGNIITNSILQISNFQYVEVKTVNTVNQTIELFFPWDKGNVTGQPAIAAPNRAAIKEAVEELRALRLTYEGLASDVSVAASANSIPRRDGSGRVKTATPSENEDAVNKGFIGTAAERNVGTGSGNVMEVGAGGLLADQAIAISNLLTENLKNGFYRFRADIDGAPAETAGSTLWYHGYVLQGPGNRVTYNFTLVTGGRSRYFIGERIATSGPIDWREIHSPITTKIDTFDFEDMPDISGFYAIEGSTNILNGPQTSGNLQIINLSRKTTIDGKVAYTGILVIDRDSGATYVGSYNISRAVGDRMRWYPIYTSKSIPEVDFNYYALRDHGNYYPSTANRNIDSVDSGDIALYATGNPGSFPVNTGIGFYHVQTRQNYTGESKSQFATGYFGTNASDDAPVYAMRTLDNSGQGWSPWANFLHDQNTNLNQFGGAGSHSVVAVGVGRTNSEILFYLPIASFKEPTGISVTGTFNIRGENNIAIGNENLNLSGTFSGTLSSTRYVALIVGGLSNITVGQTYRLQTADNISKIDVNF